ncbi:fimbrillin family protein [Phocaeicola sp.]
MNKHRIYAILGLVALTTACRQEQEELEAPASPAAHSVTASIVEVSPISPRMTDSDKQTTFEVGDAIRIGWSGMSGSPYQYTYTGENSLFAPKTDADKGLWAALTANTNANVDIYGWYGSLPNGGAMPAANAEITLPTDQNTENNYTKSLFLSAHQQVSRTADNLNFNFKHLVAYLRINLESKDGTITQDDILSSTIDIEGIHHQATVSTGTTGSEWELTPKENTTATQRMMLLSSSWSVENPFNISHQCYLIPQTLTSDNKIVITLGNGRVFTCSLSTGLELKAGERNELTITLKSGDGYEIVPTISIFKDALVSSYSGNRILAIMNNEGGQGATCYLQVYDKQADGSWLASNVYENEEGGVIFPNGQGDFFKTRKAGLIDIYGDYGVVGYGSAPSDGKDKGKGTFFVKKSKKTGKWYVAAGPLMEMGYAVAINQHFLLSGRSDEKSPTYAYIIDDNGEITNPAGKDIGINGFKLYLAENGILTGHNGVYQMSIVNGVPKATNLNISRLTRNKMATDGHRVIAMVDNGKLNTNALIYNLESSSFEEFTEPMIAGDGRPVGIYDRYALIGNSTIGALVLYYFNDAGKWQPIGDKKTDGKTDPQSFLKLAKKYNKELKDVDKLNGSNVFLKGTRALVSSDGVTYFIEHIDQMVADWLATQSPTTTTE